MGFPSSSADKESACNAGGLGSISGSGRSAWEGVSFPLEYSWASLVAQLVKRIYLQCSISGLGRSPGEGNGYLLQYSGLENSTDRGAWQATVQGGHKELDTTEPLTHIAILNLNTPKKTALKYRKRKSL